MEIFDDSNYFRVTIIHNGEVTREFDTAARDDLANGVR
jgi:hypothetical protein